MAYPPRNHALGVRFSFLLFLLRLIMQLLKVKAVRKILKVASGFI